MNIVIIGLGKVGQMLTRYLSNEGHNVVVIDQNNQKVENVVNQDDVLGISGNGANFHVLQEAGVEQADVVISVTTSDELNILSCLLAKQLGAKHIIARVRNPDYSLQSQILKEQLGFSMLINPELEAANDIRRTIMFSSAMRIDTFDKGRVEIVELRIANGMPLDSLVLNQLSSVCHSQVLICAVKREDKVFIPDGDFILKAQDHICVIGSHKDLTKFCLETGFASQKIKNVMIIGGSKIAYYLARQLSVHGIKTKIIEKNHERCVQLSELLPYSIIIEGDGSDENILKEEGIHKSDALVGLTGIDEENIVLVLAAKQLGVKKSIAKVNRMNLNGIIDHLDVDSIVEPKALVTSQIIRYIRVKENDNRSTSIQTLYKIVNEEVEAVEFIVDEKTKYCDIPLANVNTKKDLLIGSIIRQNQTIIPKGQDVLRRGDRIIVIAYHTPLKDINDIFEEEYA
ncbi:Trk system potassium transporter TrkA [Allocoprobacillus halotolerans]|uniref:Trk system potassium uptake protein TrkA n=1 Tax=Allocoprobacillus halotolerans TaxID=2944914 RepID=A0ABY5I0M4_9FIRM|nr:Trk system potassium transporter TrkA [Allocoprobacillus halotolerans]UTY38907.1 Trk system potassium transporter TrkA [Allocoprobacillus halotolerans]